jgi:hypothetical protein
LPLNWAERRPSTRRFGYTFEVSRPKVLYLEEIADHFSGALGDQHRIRLGDCLQTRGEVRRLADNAALLGLSRSDEVAHDNYAGRNAHAGLQRRGARSPP